MWKWLGIMLGWGVVVWLLVMAIHSANAEEEAQPKWKIIVTIEGPPGKQELTYGTQQAGVHWFASQEECEKARKGDDKFFILGLKALKANAKKLPFPVEITTKCVLDNSV